MYKMTKMALLMMASGFILLMVVPYYLAFHLEDGITHPILTAQHTLMLGIQIFIAMMLFYALFIRGREPSKKGSGVEEVK